MTAFRMKRIIEVGERAFNMSPRWVDFKKKLHISLPDLQFK